MTKPIKHKETGLKWCPQIPEHWDLKKVKYLIKDKDGIKIGPFGSSLKLETLVSDGIKVYGQGNVIQNDFNLGHRHIDIERFNTEFSQYEIDEGDILLTMMGTTGKAKIFNKEFKRGIIDSHLIRLRLNNTLFNNILFSVILESASYINYQIKEASRGSIMEGLNSSIVKELCFLVPPLMEQQKIADYLDRKTSLIDSIILKKEKQIELYKEERIAVINHAVTKGLNPDVEMKDSGIEWLGSIPKHWEVKRLKYLINIINGLSPEIVKPSLSFGEIPYIKVDNINKDSENISYPKERVEKRFMLANTPCILFPKRGAAIFLNKVGLISNPFCMDTNLMGLLVKNKTTELKFIFFVLKSISLEELADVSTIPQINNKHIAPLEVSYPPLLEQQKIVTYLDNESNRIDTLVSKTSKQIELLKEYKEALINEVVTGQRIIN